MEKRLFDIIISLIGLIILFPLLIVIAIVIYVSEGESVFFIQKRIGLKNKPFNLYKFRTMTVVHNSNNENFEAGNLSRITPVGRILRKTKLDELPQLLNVLKGEMSIVGPRPEVKKWVDAYPQQWAIILSVKPGITDNASIHFRNEEELLSNSNNPETLYREIILPQKLRIYNDYINNRTLLGDLKIIYKTASILLKKRAL